MDWFAFAPNDPLADYISPEMIVGCDLIYDILLHDALLNVLFIFASKNKEVEIYLANALRTTESFSAFKEKALQKGFSWEELSTENLVTKKYFYYEQRCAEIKLCRLKLQ